MALVLYAAQKTKEHFLIRVQHRVSLTSEILIWSVKQRRFLISFSCFGVDEINNRRGNSETTPKHKWFYGWRPLTFFLLIVFFGVFFH